MSKIVYRNGLPVMMAETATEPEVEERTLGEVKVTDGVETFDKLTETSRAFIERQLKTANGTTKITGMRVVKQSGGLAQVVIDRLDEEGEEVPTAISSLPTEDTDPDLARELAYKMRPSRSDKPKGVDDREWERRQDAVRDAAREMDFMEEGDVRDFLRGRASDPDLVDYGEFLRDVQEQRLDDLADILDYDLRQKVAGMRRSRRWVRLVAPKGWTTRVFAKLEDDDILTLSRRLMRRGWNVGDVIEHVIGRVKDEDRRGKITTRFNEEVPE